MLIFCFVCSAVGLSNMNVKYNLLKHEIELYV